MKKKGLKNLVTAISSQIILIIFAMITPRLFIVNLGSEANGLMSSVNQLFMFLTLFEAGVGMATTQALYPKISSDDKKGINSILSATNIFYKKVGILYTIAIFAIAIIYPFFIVSSFEYIYVVLVILCTGFSNVLTYFFQGKYMLFIEADGKSSVKTNITTLVSVISSITKIILLLSGFGLLEIQISYVLINTAQVIYYLIYIKRYYPWINLQEKPDKIAISKSKYILIHQISSLIFYNTDVLVISYCCGLKVASVYTLYNMVYTYMGNLISTFSSSFTFALGQLYHKDFPRYQKCNSVYEVVYDIFLFSGNTICLIMILPFFVLYTREITDVQYIDKWLPCLFTVINVLTNIRISAMNAINIKGLFRETAWRAILESIINVAVSIVLVNKIGIYGVLFGTIAALLYRSNDVIIMGYTKVIKKSPCKTYFRAAYNTCAMIVVTRIVDQFIDMPSSYGTFFLQGCVVTLVVGTIYIALNFLFNPKDAKEIMRLMKYK